MRREHAKTVYPPEYHAPKIDDKDTSDLRKPISPMVEKHERPISRESVYHVDKSEEDAEWEKIRKLRELNLRGEDLDWVDQDTRSLYGHYPGEYVRNEAIGAAMIEENEKERALEIYRQKTEQELKNEYDHNIYELTNDY